MNLIRLRSKKIYRDYEKKYIANIKLARELVNKGVENISLKNENTLNTIIFSISYYYHIFKDKKSLNVIEQLIRRKDLSIEVKLYLYWQLVRIDFIDIENKGHINLRNLYAYIENQFEEEKIITLPNNQEKNKNENILVFTTNQFLYNDHSPTKVLLSILKKINDNFSKIKKIYILNTREMPFTVEYFFYKPMIANCIENYEDDIFNQLMIDEKIDRCEVYYNQFDGCNTVRKRIDKALHKIYKLNPKYLISIGGSNIVSDLYRKYIDIYTIGISREVPVSNSKYLVNISNSEVIEEKKIGTDQILLEVPSSVTDIEIKKNLGKEFSREDMNIPEDMFLIVVVGNRLSKELSSDFLKFSNNILNDNNNVGFLFVGPVDNNIIKNNIEKQFIKRVFFIDYAENFVSAINLANLCINPLRLGGGLSAITAINLGIPVISHDIGDVALYLNDDFKVNNYNEMYKKVNSIIKSNEIYQFHLESLKKMYLKNSKSSWDMLLEYILKK